MQRTKSSGFELGSNRCELVRVGSVQVQFSSASSLTVQVQVRAKRALNRTELNFSNTTDESRIAIDIEIGKHVSKEVACARQVFWSGGNAT